MSGYSDHITTVGVSLFYDHGIYDPYFDPHERRGRPLFGAIREMFQLSSAAVVAQNLLEKQRSTGLLDIEPKSLSNRLVSQVVAQDRDLFNGKKGPKPHKISLAALALAQGLRDFDRNSDEYAACFLSTGVILMDLERNGGNYAFTAKDAAFLEMARREYMKFEPMDGLEAVGL
jgi:hypothetical protein